MADNTEITHGSGTVISTDEIGGIHHQRVKLQIGADGTANDVSSAEPLPTTLAAGTAEIGKVKVTEVPAIPTGTNSIGKVKSIEEALPAGTNAIGKVTVTTLEGEPKVKISSGQAISVTPQTTGGLEIKRVLSAASTNATSVKASAGQVYGWYIFNTSAAVKYVKLYNKASAPTVGGDTPVMTIPIPKESGTNIEYVNGIAFATGIALATTKGVLDSNTEAVAENDLIINLLWK